MDVSHGNSVESQVKWSYYAITSSFYAFFLSLILFVSLLEEVDMTYSVVMWGIVVIAIVWLAYHFYSIPKLVVDRGEFKVMVKGDVTELEPISKIVGIDLLTKGLPKWQGQLGHTIRIKGKPSIVISKEYYQNMDEVLRSLKPEASDKQVRKMECLFSPISIFHIFKAYRSMTSINIILVSGVLLYAFYRIVQSGVLTDMHLVVLGAVLFGVLMAIMGLVKVTGFVEVDDDKLVAHSPPLLMKRSIPKKAILKARVETRNAGRGGTIRNLVMVTKEYRHVHLSVQLNSKEDLKEIERWISNN